jgi:hypothetical protein
VNFTQFVGVDRTGFVDRTAEHVHDATERAHTDRHGDAGAGVVHLHAAAQTVGRTHGDGADDAVTQLLLHFEGQAVFAMPFASEASSLSAS